MSKQSKTISFAALPTLGAALEGGIFAGVITKQDGTHCAVIRLPENASALSWKNAMDWAKKQGGELPSRPVAAMLFANVKATLPEDWHWTSEEYNASYAWGCHFTNGHQTGDNKSYGGCAVAVRLIPLTA